MVQVVGAVSIWAAPHWKTDPALGAVDLRNHPASTGRTGRRDAGAKAAVDESGYHPANALDRAGAGLGHTFTFDAENHHRASGYTYIYDADGNRVEKTGSTGTLYWYMTPGIVTESDLTGALKSEYVFFDGERVARKDFSGSTTSIAYYFSDHLKTTDIVTDGQGNIKNESDFYPWGGELQFANSDSNHYKFGGKERDTETALDYYGARYYSNAVARFLTPDWAAKAVAVPYADFGNPQSLNLYSYTKNNPTTFGDSDGHCPDGICRNIAAMTPAQVDRAATNTTQVAIGMGKAAVNTVTSTANIALNVATNGGTYLPGTTPEIPQLQPSNQAQAAGIITMDAGLAATGLVSGGVAIVDLTSTVEAPSVISAISGAEESPAVSEVLSTIEEGGFNVTANAKTATQEANVTITHPDEPGVKLNLRTETHPLPDSGGQPVRHVNVERIEPGPKNRPTTASNEHIEE